jgi:hypothetical protein
MERGRATRGAVARQMTGAEAIEIKATIPDHQIRHALARFGDGKQRRRALRLLLRHAEARPPSARESCARPPRRRRHS